MSADTLARRRGTTTHLSPLLMKARRLGLDTPAELERLAIQRGCEYYDTQPGDSVLRDEAPLPVSRMAFSNGELAVALLCLYPPVSLLRRRMGACVLSASDVEVREVAALAQSEQCADLVRYIADCGHRIEPDVAFWKSLQLALAGVTYDANTMPHPTRFIEMTGINRGSTAIQKRWVRPVAALALA